MTCASPPECHTAAGAACDPGTGQCSYPAATDGTACGAGGTNVCGAGACVECLTDGDCIAKIDNSNGCHAISCSAANTCSDVLQHDGAAGFLVAPRFSPEVKLMDAVYLLQATFDGTGFAAFATDTNTNTVKEIRRVSLGGAVVDPAPIPIDTFAQDLAFTNGHYLVVTTEDPDATLHPYKWVAGYYMDAQGQALSAKFELLSQPATSCAFGIVGPHVVASRQADEFLVYAAGPCFLNYSGRLVVNGVPTAQYTIGSPSDYPKSGVPFERDNGFGVVSVDDATGGGTNEGRAAEYDLAGLPTVQYSPVQPVDFTQAGSQPTVSYIDMVWGSSSYLMVYSRLSPQGEIITPVSGVWQHTSGAFPLAYGQVSPTTVTPYELGFDGANFLVANGNFGSVTAQRVSEAGAVLDAAAFSLVANGASNLQLAYDRAGHYFIAYNLNDGNVYGRTFTTCP